MNIAELEAVGIRTFPVIRGINMAALLNAEVGDKPFVCIDCWLP